MKNLITIILLSLTFICQAQNEPDSSGTIIYNRGLDYYNNGDLDSAIIVWQEIVDKKIAKRYDTYGVAFFNIPTLYWQLKNYEKAKEWYLKVIESDLTDSDETGSLMEPHTNYKHKSAVALAGLFQIDSNYNEVLHWLHLADTVYRYWGFEGSATSISKRQAYLLEWKTDILLKLDRDNQAKQMIIIELICSDELEAFFENSEETLLTLVNNDTFKSEFEDALNHLNIIEKDTNNWIASFELDGLTYQIPISNIFPDLNMPHYWRTLFIEKNSTPNKNEIIEYIKNRNFYKRMNK